MGDSPSPTPEGPEPPRMVRSNSAHPKQQAPAQPAKRGFTRQAKPIPCVVLLLDGEVLQTSIHKKALGSLLFERVCDHLDLLEKEYFGLTYRDDLDPHNSRHWLDVNKTVAHQKKRGKWEFEFGVKFYPPDPTVLKESLTRYMVCLQIRKDINTQRLPCTFATQAVLGSFILQADLGDYEPEEHGEDIDYIRDIPFGPNQTSELLEKIAELHRDRKGMTPEQAELQYLEYAKKIALYGIHMHAAKDSDYVGIQIGVGASGISVYRETLRINRFVWPKVLKISYRRNKFLLRIRPGEFESFESWIAFKLPNNKLAKRLWKLAIEHHAFLRLRESAESKRSVIPRFGSKYRYSGRTLYETRVNTEDRAAPSFERTGSKQYLNNNRTRSFDSLPTKRRDPNMSVASADSFEELPTERDRTFENNRALRPEFRDNDDEPPSRVIRQPEAAPKITRPSEPAPKITRPSEPAPKITRPSEQSPKAPRPSEKGQGENGRATEIKIEHRFVQREEKGPELSMRLPEPPTEEPGRNIKRKSEHHGGVATPLAAVGLPPSRQHNDSMDSEEPVEKREEKRPPPTKPKPAKAPKPEVAKKPLVREMDL